MQPNAASTNIQKCLRLDDRIVQELVPAFVGEDNIKVTHGGIQCNIQRREPEG